MRLRRCAARSQPEYYRPAAFSPAFLTALCSEQVERVERCRRHPASFGGCDGGGDSNRTRARGPPRRAGSAHRLAVSRSITLLVFLAPAPHRRRILCAAVPAPSSGSKPGGGSGGAAAAAAAAVAAAGVGERTKAEHTADVGKREEGCGGGGGGGSSKGSGGGEERWRAAAVLAAWEAAWAREGVNAAASGVFE